MKFIGFDQMLKERINSVQSRKRELKLERKEEDKENYNHNILDKFSTPVRKFNFDKVSCAESDKMSSKFSERSSLF